MGYLAWLDRSGRLPGARLCREVEWTRAARGADDRNYPHGSRLQQDDANIDVTYNRKPDGYGPDEVGSHPASVSPFGLQDMAGNAYELTLPATPGTDSVIARGGSWYFGEVSAFITNRQPATTRNRDSTLGLRVCASFSPQ
jgi:formylglycine-generating enzyme required for sulfatase activity